MASSASQLLLLVILLTVDAILLVDARPPENKIFGGTEYDINDIPWLVSLRTMRDGEPYLCGGSIVNDRWILTAAHCTYGATARDVTVRAGSSFRSRGGTEYRVVDIKNHPRYNDNIWHNDIGLLKTERPIAFGQGVARATLPSKGAPTPPPGTLLFVSGWGLTYNHEQAKPSEHLMAVQIKMDNFRICKAGYSDYKPNAETQLCAGLTGADSCSGDSGGPLMAEGNVVIGIVSYGYPVCGASVPKVYTKVSAYIDWIEAHTRH